MTVVRSILLCDDEHLILATRAVQYMLRYPEKRDALLTYGEDPSREVMMYARRRKASISVRQSKP